MSDLHEGFQDTNLGWLPETWKTVQIDDVSVECFSGVWGNKQEEAGTDDSLARVIRVSDIKPDFRIAYDRVPLRAIRTKQLNRYRLKWGDLIVVKSSGSKSRIISGRSAFFVPPDKLGEFIPSNFTLALRTDPSISDPYFIWYYLLTRQSKRWIEHIVEGSTYPNLKKTEYLTMPIPLPPLLEQRAIAYVLRTVQQAREATERVIEAARELKRSLMRHLFTYGPVPVAQADRVELQGTEIGPVPAHWEVMPLDSLLREPLRNGRSAKVSTSNEGVRTLILTAVTQNDFCLQSTKLTEADPKKVKDLWLEPGDIFIERANTSELVGLAALYQGERNFAIFPDLLVRVRPEENLVDPRFLVEFLLTPVSRDYFRRSARKTAGNMPKINHNTIERTPIAVAPLPEQHEIARILTTVDAKVAAEETRRDALDDLFHTLLHHLVTAKVRVPLHNKE